MCMIGCVGGGETLLELFAFEKTLLVLLVARPKRPADVKRQKKRCKPVPRHCRADTNAAGSHRAVQG